MTLELFRHALYVIIDNEKAQECFSKNMKGHKSMERQTTLMKKPEVMEMLGISRSKFYQLTHEPDFPSLKIGRYVYVDRNRLNDWIAQQIDRKSQDATQTKA